jgi:glycosyltransferase involved in cell wall biosynthesis
MISILILTLNEEINLPACLESVSWSDDIVVFDSFSTDRTVEIAKAAGARVIQRKFDNWSAHQNWAVQNIEFKHPWVYYSDADEVVPQDLKEEMLRLTEDSSRSEVAYRVRFKNMFMDRWIKYSSLYPTWVMRLFQPSKVRWEREVNPIAFVDGPEGRLQSHFLHYSFNKGLEDWFAKHNRYSTQEAIDNLREIREGKIDLPGILSLRDPVRRRRALKLLSMRMPFRPTLRFLYMYLLRMGFLDGRAGLTYCRLLAWYEYQIVLKLEELRRRDKGLTV